MVPEGFYTGIKNWIADCGRLTVTNREWKRFGVGFALAVCLPLMTGLGGCSVSGALKGAFSDTSVAKTYDLVLDRQRIKRSSRLGTQLVISSPVAVKLLAGENILVKPSANEVTYYGGAVWGDRLPKLLQARMVEAVRQTGRFRAVSDGSERINGDVTLATTIEAFQVEVTGESAEANIILHCKLIHVASGKVYSSRRFIKRVGASNREVDAGVVALNSAMNDVLVSMARWIVKRGRLRLSNS